MTFGKTIFWYALSVVGASVILAPAPGGPRGAKFHPKPMTENTRKPPQGDRDHKQHGLQHGISVFRNWIRNYRFW